jgi:hypothetical protein
LDPALYLALADHGDHENQYCLGTFQTQKTSSKVIPTLIFSKLCEAVIDLS